MTTNNSINAVGFPPLSVSLGGTNLTSTTGGLILYSSSNNIIDQIPTGNNGVLVTSGIGYPTISSTLPAATQANITGVGALSSGSLTTGFSTIPVAQGGTGFSTVPANSIIYTPAANTLAALGTAANGVLVTNGSSVPSISSTLPTAVQSNITQLGNLTTLTVGSLTLSGVQIASTGTINLVATGGAGVGVYGGNLGINAGGALILYNAASTFYSSFLTQSGQAANINYLLPLTLPPANGGLLTSTLIGSLTWTSSIDQGVLTYDISGNPVAVALPATQTIVGVQGTSPSTAIIPGNNRLINESFFVWQRGAGGAAVIAVPASTTAYTADRWQIVTNAAQACTVTQAAGALSGTFMAQVQRNSGQTGTGVIKFGQSLTRDMSTAMSGAPATITFKALAGANFSSASSALTVSLITGTGSTDISGISGAAYPGSVTQSTTFTLTSTLTTFFTTFTVAAGVTQICVAFSYTPVGTAGASDYFSVTDVQLEKSPNPTAIERKTWSHTNIECSAFYQKSFPYTVAPVQNAGLATGENYFVLAVSAFGATAQTSPTIPFGLQMFQAPTITLFSPGNASAQVYDETAGSACTASAVRGTAINKGFAINYTTAGGGVTATGNLMGVHWTADCDLV